MNFSKIACVIVLACATIASADAKSHKTTSYPEDGQMYAHPMATPQSDAGGKFWFGARDSFAPARDDRNNDANGS